MELFLLILEGLLSVADLLTFGLDVYSWFRGKDNRIERRLARRTGNDVPPRDKWNRRVIICSVVVIVLTAVLVALKWK